MFGNFCSLLPAATFVFAMFEILHGQAVMADEDDAQVLSSMVRYVLEHPDGRAPFSFDATAFRDDTCDLPIGVFDSGIGGLTVLEAMFELDQFNNDTLSPGPDGRRDFENERFVYLGDQANMPYGNYSAAGKQDFLRELILKDATFLLGRRYWQDANASKAVYDKPPVKAIVIACNTATAHGLADVREAIKAWNLTVPVIGVVEAGARAVRESQLSTEPSGTIAVLATIGTCSTLAYPRAIDRELGLAGKRVPVVIQQGSLGLAGAIEGDPSFVSTAATESDTTAYLGPRVDHPTVRLDLPGFNRYGFLAEGLSGHISEPNSLRLKSLENYIKFDVTTLVEDYRRSGQSQPIDTVVLGCTHFPLAEKAIVGEFARLRELSENGTFPYRDLIAREIVVVNPAEATAKELFRNLAQARLRRSSTLKSLAAPDLFFLSVPNPESPGIRLTADGALDSAYKYGRLAGNLSLEDTRFVPLDVSTLPNSSLNLIRSRLPEVWKRLQ